MIDKSEVDFLQSQLKAERERVRELEEAFKPLVDAAFDYIEYEHDGDPNSEDARAMSEMDLDQMHEDGSLQRCRELLGGDSIVETEYNWGCCSDAPNCDHPW